MIRCAAGAPLFLLLLLSSLVESRQIADDFILLPSDRSKILDHAFKNVDDDDSIGTRWAILVAGSNGFWNYRHQVFF